MRFHDRRAFGPALVVVCGVVGCTKPAPGSDASTGARTTAPLAKVANPDRRGVEDQPDWNALAQGTKEVVEPMLPSPLPTDRAKVCTEMLDAAVKFYDATEPDSAQRDKRRAELAATREADLGDCQKDLSISAALCVTYRLGDLDSEYPWLVDQCSRAFPG